MALKNPSIQQKGTHFSQIPQANIERSSFDRGHGYKTTMDADYLIPIMCDESLPGDSFNVNVTALARLNTPITPFMDNSKLTIFHFAVPYRLIWDNWQKFNGEQTNPGDSVDYTIPQTTSPAGGYTESTLNDYMGLPTKVDITHNVLHQRAYNLIWNNWFRDENLQNSVTVNTDDGPDASTDYTLLKRGKKHDYFTSCLPWPQKGAAVSLPLGTSAPVAYETITGTNIDGKFANAQRNAGGDTFFLETATYGTTGSAIANSSTHSLYADLTAATAATINQLREAFQIQRLLERDARGGTRYIEIIKSHFGVTSPDARLQRPEFLGSSSVDIHVTPISQQSETTTASPLGALAGVGTAVLTNNGFTKSFTEHNILISLAVITADINYMSGLNRMWSRQTRYDYYWPALSHIGEQAVLNKEIWADGSSNDDLVFGYQERYGEMRYFPNQITGLFRSNATGTLDYWHLAQDFATLPALNATFIESTTPFDRVIATPSQPQFKFDAMFSMKCARPMPTYAIPGMIDHF